MALDGTSFTFRNPVIVDPYWPTDWKKIEFKRFETGLALLRMKNAPKMASGEDADYIVGSRYRVTVLVDGREHVIEVPPGMLTDLTSVPRLFRGIVGRVGQHLEAAIVHDYLYLAWQLLPGGQATRADRAFADRVMLAVMQGSGVSWVKRNAIWAALKTAGWGLYRERDASRFVDLNTLDIAGDFPALGSFA